ncbi:MAG: hypothetical protein UW95_C0006G0042 [Parcubacteria group bacterium GW2011_GWC1_45_14]|nr:MAG: hypothetical protein UW87_C0013G0007 [Candidatus Moranbacteria bacterium GW2011_GWC2_45_10]KKT94977.1 MAG: hypothetical protein UW95_C0006G0042 [Parcubacteria group bacterium GW2011_GWC1_45_14]
MEISSIARTGEFAGPFFMAIGGFHKAKGTHVDNFPFSMDFSYFLWYNIATGKFPAN